MERPGINAGTGSPGMRCVHLTGTYTVSADTRHQSQLCGRPGVGMFEQKPYCEDHMREVEEHYWARHRTSDQASPED